MKVLTVLGARPQFIKAAALSRALAAQPDVKEVLVHTGQHFDENMSAIFFREMEIPTPHYHLDVHGLDHGAMTGNMLIQLEPVLLKEKPDLVLVYGDTNSTLAGALTAVKHHIPVAHVEAGLRSFNMRMPEEVNRILTDRISKLLFCPTVNAVNNLQDEGFARLDCNIIQCGDIMEDAARYYAAKADKLSTIHTQIGEQPFALATLHRQENTNDPAVLSHLIETLGLLPFRVVLPLHPRTRQKWGERKFPENILVLEPQGYFDMLWLIRHASLVLTDSGGLQKEAFFFGKYCITLREQTEWVELVENGYNRVVNHDRALILEQARKWWQQEIKEAPALYGGGNAAEIITKALVNYCRNL